jgi:hypothetical protein
MAAGRASSVGPEFYSFKPELPLRQGQNHVLYWLCPSCTGAAKWSLVVADNAARSGCDPYYRSNLQI